MTPDEKLSELRQLLSKQREIYKELKSSNLKIAQTSYILLLQEMETNQEKNNKGEN